MYELFEYRLLSIGYSKSKLDLYLLKLLEKMNDSVLQTSLSHIFGLFRWIYKHTTSNSKDKQFDSLKSLTSLCRNSIPNNNSSMSEQERNTVNEFIIKCYIEVITVVIIKKNKIVHYQLVLASLFEPFSNLFHFNFINSTLRNLCN